MNSWDVAPPTRMEINRKKLGLAKLTLTRDYKSENHNFGANICSQLISTKSDYFYVKPWKSKVEKENLINKFLDGENVYQIHIDQLLKERNI